MKTKLFIPTISWIVNSSREILPVKTADDIMIIDRHGQAKPTPFAIGEHISRDLYEIFTTKHYASVDLKTQVFTNHGPQSIEVLFNLHSREGNIYIEGFGDKLTTRALKDEQNTLLVKPEYLDVHDVKSVLLRCVVNYKEGGETIVPRPLFSLLPWIIKNLENIAGDTLSLEYDNLTYPCHALIKHGENEDGHLITVCKNDPILMYEISIEDNIAGVVCDNIMVM